MHGAFQQTADYAGPTEQMSGCLLMFFLFFFFFLCSDPQNVLRSPFEAKTNSFSSDNTGSNGLRMSVHGLRSHTRRHVLVRISIRFDPLRDTVSRSRHWRGRRLPNDECLAENHYEEKVYHLFIFWL